MWTRIPTHVHNDVLYIQFLYIIYALEYSAPLSGLQNRHFNYTMPSVTPQKTPSENGLFPSAAVQ